MTQGELGEQAGLWQETVSKVESGSAGTKLETLCDLLAVLDLEINIAPKRKYTPEDLAEIFK